jgi:peroxiredoxin
MPCNTLTRRRLLQSTAAMAAVGISGLIPAQATSLLIGQPAPEATLIGLDGTRYATRDLIGQVVVLTFWATWCAPCRRELPALSAYAARHAADGLTVLGFSLDEPEQQKAVSAMARDMSFPVGFLTANSAPGYGRIWRMPANFTIDRAGKLADNAWDDQHEPGWTEERLTRVLDPLLKQR